MDIKIHAHTWANCTVFPSVKKSIKDIGPGHVVVTESKSSYAKVFWR